jgi:acyl carrier protein
VLIGVRACLAFLQLLRCAAALYVITAQYYHCLASGALFMSDQLRDQTRDFILQNYLFTTDTSALDPDDSLLEQGIVDSNGMMEIILFIEQQLGVVMKDEEMTPENLDSVNRITAFVLSKRSG